MHRCGNWMNSITSRYSLYLTQRRKDAKEIDWTPTRLPDRWLPSPLCVFAPLREAVFPLAAQRTNRSLMSLSARLSYWNEPFHHSLAARWPLPRHTSYGPAQQVKLQSCEDDGCEQNLIA